MSKRYIDFAPARKSSGKRSVVATQKPATVQRPAVARKPAPVQKPATVRKPASIQKPVAQKPTPAHKPVTAHAKEPVLGVIEDLGTGGIVASRAENVRTKEVAEAKAKKIGVKAKEEKATATGLRAKIAEKTFKTPKPRFINQDKIVKRPLSKNVYRKKVVTPKEEPKGPVTIITKPEKQAHVSLIITIILTIILGAAAGTVAFLLLPK